MLFEYKKTKIQVLNLLNLPLKGNFYTDNSAFYFFLFSIGYLGF